MHNLDRINSEKTFSESVILTRHFEKGEYDSETSLSFPLPNECPHCIKGISPNCLHIEVDNSGKNKIDQTREEWFAYAFFHCPYCGRAFYVTQGWMYLAVVLDLFNRQIVGWSLDVRMKKELIMDALTKAYETRKPEAGLICHSDRGSQYCSHEYQQLLKDYHIRCSMSRKAQCLDNACAETFFHSMKVEWFYGKPLQSKYFTQKSIAEYIEVFYNRQRLHSTLGYLPPCQFEANYHFSRFHLSA